MAVDRGQTISWCWTRRLAPPPRLGQESFFQREACQVLPLNRLGTRAKLAMLPLIRIETGRRTHTQSSGQRIAAPANGSLVLFTNRNRGREANTRAERPVRFGLVRTSAVSPLGRSRPAADAAREVTQRWLLDGVDISVGHRRYSRDPSEKKDAGRTPAS